MPWRAYLALALAAAILAVYWTAQENDFSMDDAVYLTANPNLKSGLSAEGILWAFRSTEALNWHPVTWLSHLFDYQLFGLKPRWPHLINAGLHALNAALLFLALRAATGATARSLLVAALFGLHPLHVQSVAWISERKDLLAGLFFILVWWAYIAYARRPSRFRLAAVATLFALGLMAKPMLVTIPFVLLLTDAWPLGRLARTSWRRYVTEKVPLFVLAAASSAITYIVQTQGGAVKTLEVLPFPERLANAAISYAGYLGKTIWPFHLAIIYPYPSSGIFPKAIVAALFLATITVFVIRSATRRPFIAFGWFLYLGMLIPVIGLVQVGTQPLADRYTYLPLIGIFVAVAFVLPDLSTAAPAWRGVAACAAGSVIVLCAILSHIQLGYWKNNIELYRHAATAVEDNWEASGHLGFLLAWYGNDPEESLRYFRESLRVRPDNYMTHLNMGVALNQWGRSEEAAAHLSTALTLHPGSSRARIILALALALERLGRKDEAAVYYKEATATGSNQRLSPEAFKRWHPTIEKQR